MMTVVRAAILPALVVACTGCAAHLGASADAGAPANDASPANEAEAPGFRPAAAAGLGVVIGAGDASPWMIGVDGLVYHYNNDAPPPRAWVQEPNAPQSSANTFSLAVSPEGTPWKIDADGHVWARTGPGAWEQRGVLTAYEIGVGRASVARAISRDCTAAGDCDVYAWNGRYWAKMRTAAQHVAVAPDGATYVTTSSGAVLKLDGDAFVPWGGGQCARHNGSGGRFGVPVIGAASNDSVWVVGCSSGAAGEVYAYLAARKTWQRVPARASTISVGADGTPWVVDTGPSAAVPATNVYEYVSAWNAVGPTQGFTLSDGPVQRRLSGEVHDVAVSTTGRVILAGTVSGGVWRALTDSGSLRWEPIGDVGAGVDPRGTARAPGPDMTISSLAIDPTNDVKAIVATGAGPENRFLGGNGFWYTPDATKTPVSWSEALCDGARCTSPAKIRYSADGSRIYAASSPFFFLNGSYEPVLYVGREIGGVVSFSKAGATCQPKEGDAFTDLVVDQKEPGTFFAGVAHEGVYWSNDYGRTCTLSTPGALSAGDARSTASVALALTTVEPRVLYAMVARPAAPNDFQGIFAATAPSFAQGRVVVAGSATAYPNLDSQGARNWALATNPTGSILLAGSKSLWRGAGCGSAGCSSFARVPNDGGYADHYSILWASDDYVYAVNDGGIFRSSDGGESFHDTINGLGIANEVSVAVGAKGAVYATAWDVGANYTVDGSTWVGGSAALLGDGHQIFVDPSDSRNVFHCSNAAGSGTGGGQRFWFDGATWTNIDNAPVANDARSDPCELAKGSSGNLLTIYGNGVFQSPDHGKTWDDYGGNPLPAAPQSIVASDELATSVYLTLANDPRLFVSPNSQSWRYAALPPGWPAGHEPRRVALDSNTGDVYLLGADGCARGAVVYASPVAQHGASWSPLTGSGALELDQVDMPNSIGVDPSARTVIVAMQGYAGFGVVRLNNPDVIEQPPTATHHWRPWVRGLPNASQPVEWITGQFEDGVYYYYIATWGRGVYRREARGGDF